MLRIFYYLPVDSCTLLRRDLGNLVITDTLIHSWSFQSPDLGQYLSSLPLVVPSQDSTSPLGCFLSFNKYIFNIHLLRPLFLPKAWGCKEQQPHTPIYQNPIHNIIRASGLWLISPQHKLDANFSESVHETLIVSVIIYFFPRSYSLMEHMPVSSLFFWLLPY